MFKNLFKRKDEFQLFLERVGITSFYELLDEEEKEKFKESCYTGFSIASDGTAKQNQLAKYSEKAKAVWGISNSLNYNKNYHLALRFLDWGLKFAIKREDITQFHINYALNYEKLKDVKKCIHHCEEALKLDHIGYYAYERLIKDYVKIKDYDNALRMCNIVLKSRKTSVKTLHDYAKRRRQFILKQMKKIES